ncbi:MAG: YtxH domain-containing protein [Candidatus Pacebacteria bacterium]|jgi:hypothetical protein|nr:YtxH domain-containing protein [Candidatus Paceibacterota bacterium]
MENNNCHPKKMKVASFATGFAAGMIVMLLLSPKMRGKAGQWASDMRDEIMKRAKETKDITQEKYNQIVDEASSRYGTMKDVSRRELSQLMYELKSHWDSMVKETKKQIPGPSEELSRKESTDKN